MLNHKKIAIFGGIYLTTKGLAIFDTEDNSCKAIPPSEDDLRFECFTRVQQVSAEKFVTLGRGEDNNIHMVQFIATSEGRHYEVRSIHNFGPL